MDPGFEIDAKFYPIVAIQDWRNSDFVLAHQVTQVVLDDLLDAKDTVLYRQALVAVAVRHGQPDLKPGDLIDWLGNLKPADIKNIGLDEGDALPPEPGEDTSENAESSSPPSEASTDATPAS